MAISTIPAPLTGKVAVVTGGSRGIGAGIASHLVSKGVSKIAITYSSNASAAESSLAAIRKINADVLAVAIQSDVLSPTFAKDLVDVVLKELRTDKIDIIVGNAALVDASTAEPILSTTKSYFDKILTANAWAPLSLFNAALPHIPRGGRVIFIGSVASKLPQPGPVALYSVSKSTLDSITRNLAAECGIPYGITVNSVSVGITKTDAVSIPLQTGVMTQDYVDSIVSRTTAAKRMGEVEDIAGIVGFLASDEARWINGNNVPANGGSMLGLQG